MEIIYVFETVSYQGRVNINNITKIIRRKKNKILPILMRYVSDDMYQLHNLGNINYFLEAD